MRHDAAMVAIHSADMSQINKHALVHRRRQRRREAEGQEHRVQRGVLDDRELDDTTRDRLERLVPELRTCIETSVVGQGQGM